MKRIAIITGATGGLGREFTLRVSEMEEIEEIWAVGRNQQKLADLAASCPKVIVVTADLAKDGTDLLIRKLKEEQPEVRLLINNAGIGYFGRYEEMEAESVKTFCAVNCTACAVLMNAALPFMKEGSGILNLSSASSFQPNPYLALYSADKVFVKNLSRAVNAELKGRKITVTAVCPGWIDTEMLPRSKNGHPIHYAGMISAEKVVRQALLDNRKGKEMSTPGWFSKYFRFYSKYMPTKVIMRQWMRIVSPMLQAKDLQ